MAHWDALGRELDAWEQQGRTATVWWRDDDAVRPSAALDRLLALGRTASVPVALAVIPRDAGSALSDRLADEPLVSVLQHGWSHENHAPPGDRQEEFGADRPLAERLDDLAGGRQRLMAFRRFLPVLVAPWNRIDDALIPHLPEVGLSGVSTLGPRPAAEPAPGVHCTNVHVDIIDWQGTRGFVGEERALAQLVAHLQARRSGRADAGEPTGLMTHHLFHDSGCWAFIAALFARSRAHAALRWLDGREAFRQ
jgi:hypothetical protein